MSLNESGEMYLEAIYVLCREQAEVRAIDVAEYRGFSKPSVSRGVGLLKEQGYITVDPHGRISLTEQGHAAATNIFERHTVLSAMLQALGVDAAIAVEDACRIEHVISEESFRRIKAHFQDKT